MATRYQFQAYRYPKDTGLTVQTWGGWMWTERDECQYRTDTVGEGLWKRTDRDREWKQILGTSQFSLPEDRQAALRKLRRMGHEVATIS